MQSRNSTLRLRDGHGRDISIFRVDPPEKDGQTSVPWLDGELSEGESAVLEGRLHAQLRIGAERAVMRALDLVHGQEGYSARGLSLIATDDSLTIVAPEKLPVVAQFLARAADGDSAPDGVPGLVFLLYALLAERYHAAGEELVEEAEQVAQRVLIGPKKGLADATFRVRRDAYALRLAVSRARSTFAVLVHERPHGWPERAKELFLEILDRLEPIHEDIENVRESLGETVEAYSSVQANEINEVMRLFTLISMLFLPPTLIASIYGMNFRMPEYHWPQGYAFSLGLMALLTGAMLLYARLRRWLR